jgi:putative membrane-bound dehydrogenase-like protein
MVVFASETFPWGLAAPPVSVVGSTYCMQRLAVRLLPNLLAFISSLCVVTFELISSQLIVRDLGSRVAVWVGLTGNILGGLCLGSVLGGLLAGRVCPRRAIGPLFALGSFLMLFLLLANPAIGEILPRTSDRTKWHILAEVTLAVLIPTTILGMIGPVVARMAVEPARKAGTTIGGVYSWGTIGLIAGALLSGFVLVYSEPSSVMVHLAAAALALLAALLCGADTPSVLVLGLLTALCLVLGSLGTLAQKLDLGLLDLGSSYQIDAIDLACNVLALAMAAGGLAGLAGARRRDEKTDIAITDAAPAAESADHDHLYPGASTAYPLTGSRSGNSGADGFTGLIKDRKQAILWLVTFAAMLGLSSLVYETRPGWFYDPTNPARLSAEDAAAGFRVRSGLQVGVFAAEPDVQNPIAMAWDHRGRLWVAENYTYAEQSQQFDLSRHDRVLIFEDSDGDGRFDRRKVFTEDSQRLSSVELGFGGVWLLCPPRLLFLPDRNGDDVPDGPADVVLDGFTIPPGAYWNIVNGLRWGPDGWLYGRCGGGAPAQVGTPGAPDALRIPLRGGLWRYHPSRMRFEVLAHGTSNPWGHDWNALGEAFFTNTVNGHLWHVIPGAHLARKVTLDPNPRAYAQIDLHADHWHTNEPGSFDPIPGAEFRAGGGHAHTGAMIYQGDQWPAAYRDQLLTLNYLGRRVNVERLERSGGGYVGRHEKDMLFASDHWFRGIDLGYGPDGGVFILDWSDTGECHEYDGVDRASGRIYKVTYGTPKRVEVGDLSTLHERELVALHRHPNEWFVREARRVLAERSAGGDPLVESREALRALVSQDPDPVRKLRALWSLFVIGGADGPFLRTLLDHEHEAVRAWAIRLLTDDLPLDSIFSTRIGPDVEPPADLLARLATLAREDPSGLVRLVLASTLQRLPVSRRVPLARALASHAEDSSDHNQPAMIWTGLIPVADSDPAGLASLAGDCQIPDVVGMIARRLAEEIESRPGPVNALLSTVADRPEPFRLQVVTGLSAGLTGWRKARKPEAWDKFRGKLAISAGPGPWAQVRDLEVLFGDGRALDDVRHLALDETAEVLARKAALRTLIENRPPDLRSICERLIHVKYLNVIAARGLALFDDPALGELLVRNYYEFQRPDRPSVLDALVSRSAFAGILLDEIAAGRIPRQDLTPFHARQVNSLGDPALSKRLSEVWGVVHATTADRRNRINELKKQLGPASLAQADRSHGRAVFERVCSSCHRLYGRGGAIGPDLTGSGRDNLDYLLENIVDPGASVNADFRMVVIALSDGRVLNGLIKAQTAHTITLQTQTEAIALERSDIEGIQPSTSSLMPDGLLNNLRPDEIRDLISYLSYPMQVPLPTEAGGG